MKCSTSSVQRWLETKFRLGFDWRYIRAPVFVCALVISLAGCQASRTPNPVPTASVPQPDINIVLRAHDRELMAIPGVVGVYVGLEADERTPCLKVMVVKKTRDLRRAVPKALEGYKVEVEESGVIRPM
jgi:hypothetical protein